MIYKKGMINITGFIPYQPSIHTSRTKIISIRGISVIETMRTYEVFMSGLEGGGGGGDGANSSD